jgi:hypothetical protein
MGRFHNQKEPAGGARVSSYPLEEAGNRRKIEKEREINQSLKFYP